MSERNLSTEVKEQVSNDVLAPIFMMKADFPAGEIFIWTGYGEIEWDGETWTGMGDFLSLDIAQETLDGSAQGTSVTLGGIDSEIFDGETLGDYQGRPASLYLATVDQDTGEVIPSPYLIFSGQLDSDESEDAGNTMVLRINVEHRLADLLRAREYRYTDQDQQALYPGDRGLEFVGTMVDISLQWGSA